MIEINPLLGLLIFGIIFALTFLWKPKKDLTFDELDEIFFPPNDSVEIISRADGKLDEVDISLQLRGDDVSILYYRSEHPEGVRETIDICTPKRYGILLRFTGGKAVTYSRIGWRDIFKEIRSENDRDGAVRLLNRVRKIIEKQTASK